MPETLPELLWGGFCAHQAAFRFPVVRLAYTRAAWERDFAHLGRLRDFATSRSVAAGASVDGTALLNPCINGATCATNPHVQASCKRERSGTSIEVFAESMRLFNTAASSASSLLQLLPSLSFGRGLLRRSPEWPSGGLSDGGGRPRLG